MRSCAILILLIFLYGFSLGNAQMTQMRRTISSAETVLPPCPDSPNCVCSLFPENKHYIEPLPYTGSFSETKQRLLAIINTTPRAKVVKEGETSLQVEYTSALFRFVDDVLFYFDDEHQQVQVRSASRSGYYDFGVNRSRVEEIRTRLRGNE